MYLVWSIQSDEVIFRVESVVTYLHHNLSSLDPCGSASDSPARDGQSSVFVPGSEPRGCQRHAWGIYGADLGIPNDAPTFSGKLMLAGKDR